MFSHLTLTSSGGGVRTTFDSILQRPDARVLDLCCGTGDMTLRYARRANSDSRRLSARITRTPCCSGRP